MIQCIAGNPLGGADKESTAYNFTGQPVMRIHEQYKKSSQPLQTQLAFTETYTYAYDHAGRPVTVKHKINGQDEQVISSLTYNELGQLAQKKQGGISPLSYTYNIRGWLTRIQASSLFVENLYYTSNPNPGDDIHYNGNISAASFSGMAKKSNGQLFQVTKNMSYRYDGLNRLKAAEIRNSHDGFDLYFELYSYDKNGNILSLARSWKDSQEDELSFTYTGNRMTRVSDAGNDMYLSSVPQIPCNIYDGAFSYDANGNRTKDVPRKIKSLSFNELNLPREFQMTGGEYMKVRYSADGRKLGTESRWYEKGVVQPGELMELSGRTGQTIVEKHTKYAANAVYESPVSGMDILGKIYIDGGYLTYDKSASKYIYHYYYQDHLGSNCVVRKEDGTTEQSVDYLPSGIPTSEFGPLTADNRLHVNMEFESLLGIHLYDNGARWRDPVYNVFISPDPLCEKFPGLSPYAVYRFGRRPYKYRYKRKDLFLYGRYGWTVRFL